jgi:N-acetylmuramoyl-L-alanine amidase
LLVLAQQVRAATTTQIQRGVTYAAAYGADNGMRAGVAVEDLKTGRIWTGGVARRRFAGASVVKTMIATRLLLTDQMHGAVQKKAWYMITRSDNDAAWALYPKVGRDRLLPWISAHYRLGDIGARPTMPGIWGSTQITARGMVRFYRAVHDDPTVWPWLGKAMHAYAQRSSAGEPNAFGLAAAAPASAVKNGWDTHRDVKAPSNAIINSTGYTPKGRYAVAILTEGPGSLYYAAGERIVTAMAVRVIRGLRGLPVRPPAPHRTIVLDPGHNGGNSTHLREINRLVYAGYGRRKPCNTTGTATNGGYPEHAFTWRVANLVKRILIAHQVTVIMTRSTDTGVGPCVNRRAAIESTKGVSAAIAIHADGAPGADHGFHLCVDSRRPEHATRATVGHTKRLNAALHKALAGSSGLSVANYVGNNGYYYRDDLAGLNLSTNPTAFLELGNMRNRHDAALQHSRTGRIKIAKAITRGILAYLAALP